MITCVAIEASLLLKKYQQNFLELFLESLYSDLADRPDLDTIKQFFSLYLADINTNSEYVSNHEIFKRYLAKFYKEDSIIEVSSALQKSSEKFIDKAFQGRNINPIINLALETLNQKNIYRAIILEPYFNEKIATLLLSKVNLTTDEIDFISTNNSIHYGKNNIRFYFELLEKLNCQSSPEKILYISSDLTSINNARKLGCQVYYVSENANDIKYSGSIEECLDFLKQLPEMISS